MRTLRRCPWLVSTHLSGSSQRPTLHLHNSKRWGRRGPRTAARGARPAQDESACSRSSVRVAKFSQHWLRRGAQSPPECARPWATDRDPRAMMARNRTTSRLFAYLFGECTWYTRGVHAEKCDQVPSHHILPFYSGGQINCALPFSERSPRRVLDELSGPQKLHRTAERHGKPPSAYQLCEDVLLMLTKRVRMCHMALHALTYWTPHIS